MKQKEFINRDGKSFIVTVDDENEHLLEKYEFFLRNGRPAITVTLPDGKIHNAYLHRMLLSEQIEEIKLKNGGFDTKVKFIDGDPTNCTMSNLKILYQEKDLEKPIKKKTKKDAKKKKEKSKEEIETKFDKYFKTSKDKK